MKISILLFLAFSFAVDSSSHEGFYPVWKISKKKNDLDITEPVPEQETHYLNSADNAVKYRSKVTACWKKIRQQKRQYHSEHPARF